MNEMVYLEGKYHGLYGRGAVIFARRDQSPGVEKNRYHTIEEVVATDIGSCGKNLMVKLEGIQGLYSRKTFKVNEDCWKKMTCSKENI